MSRKTRVTTVDEYLATLSDDKRAALEKLRKTIRAAAPNAEECISYQLPAFRLNGMLVAEVKPDRVKLTLGEESEELLLKLATGPKTTTVAPPPPPAQPAGPAQPQAVANPAWWNRGLARS